jgi:diguanylate cyclase
MTYFYQHLYNSVRQVSHHALWRNGLLLLSWLLVWGLGLLVEYTEHASIWFPAAGLTCAALFIVGVRAIPVLLIGCVIVTFWTGHHYQLELGAWQLLQAGLLFGIAHILPYYTGARLLRRIANMGQFHLPLLVIGFLLIAAVSSLLATITGLAALVVSQMMPFEAVSQTWLPFWVGDMAGVMVIAPLFSGLLAVLYPSPKFVLEDYIGAQQRVASAAYKYKLLLTSILLTLAMLLAWYADTPESAFAIFFLVIPHMWIACTESAFFTALSVALSSFLIALLVNQLALMDYAMVYQFAVNVIAANALFGVAVPALMKANKQLRLIVSTDSLTKVASRSHLQQRAELEIVRSLEQQEPLCLMVFDIDHFKQINDQLGHSVGDQVLREACQAAQQMLRPTDVIGRYGGDEFVVILPHTGQDAVVAIGQRIIARLKDIKLTNDFPVSASFGVAALVEDDCFRTLFERADVALYRAKKQGRNQVAWH